MSSEVQPNDQVCPCDRLVFPPKPVIPEGLTTLPRQLAGFPEYRLSLLSAIRDASALESVFRGRPLNAWRAREGDDLGVMLLEMWAYVLDILAFYDGQISNESYLRTAKRPESLKRLVRNIGYHPLPAVAGSVTLSLLAEKGEGFVAVPPGVAFRSAPFGDEPAQVFETTEPTTIDPRRNRWTLAPIRDPLVGDRLYMEVGGTTLEAGDVVLFQWGSNVEDSAATRVKEIVEETSLDGNVYLRLEVEQPPAFPPETSLADIRVSKPTSDVAISFHFKESLASGRFSVLTLGTFVSDLLGSYAIVENRNSVEPTVIFRHNQIDDLQLTQVYVRPISLRAKPASTRADGPLDGVAAELAEPRGVSPPPPSQSDGADFTDASSGDAPRLHFELIDAGRLVNPAKPFLTAKDLIGSRRFTDLHEPLEQASEPNPVQMLGDEGVGATRQATAKVDSEGKGRLESQDPTPFVEPLRVPVRVFGNLVRATRGESVLDEILGSGNGSLPFQRFTLAKSPLTYVRNPTNPAIRESTLQVSVNDILWTEVSSFFGQSPDAEVYVVRHDPETNEAMVTFGDGVHGARLPTGVENVVASYRFGAGRASPPANSITQLGRPVAGIRAAENPVSAELGADGDNPQDLRKNAPNSGLLFGRAVSLQDMETAALQEVDNARVDWTWDATAQRPVIKVWFIGDGSNSKDNETKLRSILRGQMDPHTPIVVCQARENLVKLVVDFLTDERRDPVEVEQAVIDALTDPENGILSISNVRIGGTIFRSAILEQVKSVSGVKSVRALAFQNQPMGPHETAPEGHFFNFFQHLRIGSTEARQKLLAKSQVAQDTNLIAFLGHLSKSQDFQVTAKKTLNG